jgi:hypothetical protein
MSDFKQSLKMQGIKVKSEKETRKHILKIAKEIGCEIEATKILTRYENLCKQNPKDSAQLATMCMSELYRLMGCYEGLSIDGEEIIPADQEYISGLKNYKSEDKKIQKV